jgi:hypothetical protein
VAASVAKQDHKIQNQPVKVSVYTECLGLSGGHEEPTVPIPSPIMLTQEDIDLVYLLDMLPNGLESLQASLYELYGNLILQREARTATVECTLTPEVEGLRQRVKTWADDVMKNLKTHLQGISRMEIFMSQNEFEGVQGIVQEMVESNEDIGYDFEPKQNLLVIAYRGQQMLSLIDSLTSKVEEARTSLNRKMNEKKEKIDQSKGKLLLLQKHKTLQEISNQHPEMTFNIQPEEGFVELTGLPQEVQDAKLMLMQLFTAIAVVEHQWETQVEKDLMAKDTAKAVLMSKLEDLCADDVVDITSERLVVCSFTEERAERLRATAIRAIERRVIKFEEQSKLAAVKDLAWEMAKSEIMEENEELMSMHQDAKSLTIVSVHAAQQVQKSYTRLENFLQEKSVCDQEFPLPKVLHTLFRPYLQQKINSLQIAFDDFNFDEDDNKVPVFKCLYSIFFSLALPCFSIEIIFCW